MFFCALHAAPTAFVAGLTLFLFAGEDFDERLVLSPATSDGCGEIGGDGGSDGEGDGGSGGGGGGSAGGLRRVSRVSRCQ